MPTRRLGGAVLILVIGAALVHASVSESSSVAPALRAFSVTYAATITNLPSRARQIRIWIPLAKSRDNQQILSRDIRTEWPYELHHEPTFGNDILYLTVTPPIPSQVIVTVEYHVVVETADRLPATGIETTQNQPLTREALTLALRNEPFMVINETVTQLAQAATTGRTSELDRARAIYDYVLQHMQYDKTTPGWGKGDTLRACQLGKGNCTDFHSLFISMARSVGIPAQFVIGTPVPEGAEGDIPGYHCWAEFYTPQAGWVPVDASEAWKHPERREYYFGAQDPNRLLISRGRNLQLVPAQAGGPVNIFIYPYVEVDGAPFGAVQTRFQFRQHATQEEAV